MKKMGEKIKKKKKKRKEGKDRAWLAGRCLLPGSSAVAKPFSFFFLMYYQEQP